MNSPYKDTVEARMVDFYRSLSEKDRRRYAAIEALKLPHGGKKYICELLDCDPKTIEMGLSDLLNPEELKKKK
jgi:hypothetical protein